MPGITGLLLALPVGRFLQSRPYIVPWFSFARLLVISSYALTGLVPFFFARQTTVPMILLIWALATLPQTMVAVCFSVVMNAVAGPEGRFNLMSRRWSILGFTSALTVALVGWLLDQHRLSHQLPGGLPRAFARRADQLLLLQPHPAPRRPDRPAPLARAFAGRKHPRVYQPGARPAGLHLFYPQTLCLSLRHRPGSPIVPALLRA